MFSIKQIAAVAALAGVLLIPAFTHASSTRAGLPTVYVKLTGNSITVSGSLQSGWVNVVTTTTNEQLGELTFAHLNPGVTLQQAQAFSQTRSAQDLNAISARAGHIVLDAGAPRGVSTVQTYLLPGTYLAFDVARNNPAKQPKTTFTISQSANPAPAPAAQAHIHIIEFGFKGNSTFHVGDWVRIYNNGYLVHMAALVRAKSLRDANLIATYLHQGKDKLARPLATGFVDFAGPISHNAQQQIKVPNMPGYYVLACFMDTQDGREHTQLGMERVVQIVPAGGK